MGFNVIFYFFMTIPILNLFYYQIYNFKIDNPANSLKIFKSNNLLGLLVFISILMGKI
jgi:4-hydroxybenzoate polyprenyltransferase